MSIVRFEIYFDNPHATYFCGEHVAGRVVIQLQREKKIRAVDLKFSGEAKVSWPTGENGKFRNKAVYLREVIDLAGGSGADITLSPGTHTYSFRYILPRDIPSSFESKYGHVRYTAKATIRRSFKFDHQCKSAFTVIYPLDLNNEPDAMKPVRIKEEKRLCLGFGSPITLELSLPFSGYVPGQICHADFKLENRTSNFLTLIASIEQVIKLKADGGRKKTKEKTICENEITKISPQGSKAFTRGLRIPAVPDSYLRNCKFIDISYIFKIRCILSGMHGDVCFTVPIVVGSIPLRSQFNYLLHKDQCISLPNNDEGTRITNTMEGAAQISSPETSAFSNPFCSYPDMPPPSYEECMYGTQDIRDEEDNEYVRGATAFAPRYPVYSFKENQL